MSTEDLIQLHNLKLWYEALLRETTYTFLTYWHLLHNELSIHLLRFYPHDMQVRDVGQTSSFYQTGEETESQESYLTCLRLCKFMVVLKQSSLVSTPRSRSHTEYHRNKPWQREKQSLTSNSWPGIWARPWELLGAGLTLELGLVNMDNFTKQQHQIRPLHDWSDLGKTTPLHNHVWTPTDCEYCTSHKKMMILFSSTKYEQLLPL